MKTRPHTCVSICCTILIQLAWALPGFAQSANPAARQPAVETAQSGNQGRAAITGEWDGKLSRLRLIVKIEQSPDARLKGTLISVDQGNASIPIDVVSLNQDGVLHLDLKLAGASYEGKLSADGTEIAGTWKQGGATLPLLLHRPGTSARPTLKPRTQGQIALEPCRTLDGNMDALCGKYDVYENRATRQGRKVALNIMLLPSTAAKAEPDAFFGLAGGPGQSAVEAYPLAGYIAKVRELRDVVLVDQRGTGQSNPLPCALQSLDDAQAVLGEPFSSQKIRECRAQSDRKADTTQYTTSIAADDLDEVRQAMGYDKINIFGGSYGTKAALVYLRLHGDHVRTVGLEAVASPQYLIPLPFAKSIQSSVDGVIALCAADAACNKVYPDLRKEFNTVVERLAKFPAQFQFKNQSISLSREMFVSKLRPLLYVPPFVSTFPLIVHNAYQNNWSPYANITLSLAGALEGVVARGASFAALCAEDVPGLTESAIRRDTSGTYLGDSQVRRFQKYCEAWGKPGSIPRDFYAPVRSQVPALLISGMLDPATPPRMAEQAAHDLTNSRLIAVKQGTHGTGSPCIDGLVAEFVKQGSAKALDASCADEIHLPPFVTLPAQATSNRPQENSRKNLTADSH